MWKFMLCFTKSDIFRMCSELGWGREGGWLRTSLQNSCTGESRSAKTESTSHARTADENTLIQRNCQLNELAKKKKSFKSSVAFGFIDASFCTEFIKFTLIIFQ